MKDIDNLYEKLLKNINEEIKTYEAKFVNAPYNSLEAYKYEAGMIKGLKIALDAFQVFYKKLLNGGKNV